MQKYSYSKIVINVYLQWILNIYIQYLYLWVIEPVVVILFIEPVVVIINLVFVDSKNS